MKNEQERQLIDFDQVLLDIQEENVRRLAEVMEGTASSEPVVDSAVGGYKIPRIIDIFIPPRGR
jgi:hypothetical protein